MDIKSILKNAVDGKRISRTEGLILLQHADHLALGEAAQVIRFQKHPKPWVTYVVDSNPNYSNVCDIDCIF